MQVVNMHHIQKHILRVLTQQKWSRFRDMKPRNVDSNLYNYHLKLLIKEGMVEKVEGQGYRLSPDGLRFVDHVSLENFEPRWQPKILTKAVIVNKHNEIVLWPKYKQPFIGRWSLPSGKMHYDDKNAESAIIRELTYITDNVPKRVEQRGVVEYSVYVNHKLVTHTLTHIFAVDIDYDGTGKAQYHPLATIDELDLSPGTAECIRDVLTKPNFFYSSYDIDW